MALTIAAAAGVGAASTAAGTQPWTASLNSMARTGHTTGSTKTAAGQDVFGAMAAPARSAGKGAGTHAAPIHGSVKVDADQKANQATAPKNTPAAPSHARTGVEGLLPLPNHPAAAQKPAAPAHKAAVPHKAAPKPTAPKAAPAAPSKPYTVYDSTNPGHIPSGESQVAVYANGAYQASWNAVSGRHSVLWIDANGGNPGCNVLDVEPGDASPSTAATWVNAREHKEPGSVAIVYTMLSEWSAVKSAVGALPASVQSHVRYWIADPTGSPHIVPGSSATQWNWGSGYDITEALPNFTS